MRKQNSFYTLIGLVLSGMLLGVLGLALKWSGGMAFSPGRLSAKSQPGIRIENYASHAEFQSDCGWCHQPLRVSQAELCVDCHAKVKDQITMQSGTHGFIDIANACATCHSDHQGAEFDPTTSAYPFFNHSAVGFSLDWHKFDYDGRQLTCKACHDSLDFISLTAVKCLNCHMARNITTMKLHSQQFGLECLECHDGKDRMIDFDHNASTFPLEGKHEQVMCTECHGLAKMQAINRAIETKDGYDFSGLPAQCSSCHDEPSIHYQVFTDDCGSCHSPQAWSPAILIDREFEHAVQAGFSLIHHTRDFSDYKLTCFNCHPGGLNEFELGLCITCHSPDQQSNDALESHREKFGLECLSCHDGVDRMHDFDHAETYLLDGQHRQVRCENCHAEKKFTGTPRECLGCHAEPAIHAGDFGLKCQYCHVTQAWTPARLIFHDFPLEHGEQIPLDLTGEGESSCRTCHPISYPEYSCTFCHEHNQEKLTSVHLAEFIPSDQLNDCISCHINRPLK